MSDLIDIINEQDEVIGQATKKEAHEKGLLHRFIHVFVFTKDGEMVIQWRKKEKLGGRMFDPSAGGHVDAGEDYETAANRELKEELGIEGDLQPLCDIQFKVDVENNGVENMRGQLFQVFHDGPYSNWEDEAEHLEFMGLEELALMMERFPYLFTEGFKSSFRSYLEFLDSLEYEE